MTNSLLPRRSLLLACTLAACAAPAEPPTGRAAEAQESSAGPARPGGVDVPDPRAATVARIFEVGLRSGRAFALLEELCRVAPARLSGSDGAARAVEWGAERMRALGLENVRLEPCTVPRWVRGDVESLAVVEPAAARGLALPIHALGGSVGTDPGGIEALLLRVTSFEELRARAAQARGRIVLFDRPMDPGEADPFAAYGGAVDQRVRGAIEAAAVGAVGALVRSMTLARDDVPHTGAMRYDDAVPAVPAAAVSTLGADRLAALLAGGTEVRVRLALSCRTLADVESANVVGEIVGRELPQEIVLIGGHLDAWDVSPGAHDDAAGCAQTLEAARLLLELGLRPRRTLRVVWFMNEENGLRGGRAYREAHLAELPRHVLALESDRGGFAPRGFATDAPPARFAELERHVRLLEPWGAGLLLQGSGGADISPMRQDGVVLAEYLPDAARYFDFHHAASDVPAAVSPREVQLGAAAIAAFAWCVADAP